MGKKQRMEQVMKKRKLEEKAPQLEDDDDFDSDESEEEEEQIPQLVPIDDQEVALPPGTRLSSDPPKQQGKWINKQRVLIFASRGITFRDRHLMNNLRDLLAHSKQEPKVEPKEIETQVDEICMTRNCNLSMFFENKKRQDLYCWMSVVGSGPTIKFGVENVHTMGELKMTGNCLKGSRPFLSFDKSFEKYPHMRLMMEVLTDMFGVPLHHPKSQPFYDHMFTFTWMDNRIWFRNYQIVGDEGALAEIGPRFVLNPIRIFEGSMGGQVLWANEHYVSPNQHRARVKEEAKTKYKDRLLSKHSKESREPAGSAYEDIDRLGKVFDTIRPEEAVGMLKHVFPKKAKKHEVY